jgi:hypothetical protein
MIPPPLHTLAEIRQKPYLNGTTSGPIKEAIPTGMWQTAINARDRIN